MSYRKIDTIGTFFYNSLFHLNKNITNLNYRIIYSLYNHYRITTWLNSCRRFSSSTHFSNDVVFGRRTRSKKYKNTLEGEDIKENHDEIDLKSSESTGSGSVRIRRDLKYENGKLRGVHFAEHYNDSNKFVPHPFNRRFAYSKRPLFPIEPRNLRIYGLLKHKKRGVGKKCNAKGVRHKHQKKRGSKPNSRTFEGGQTPLYKRLPKFPEAILSRFDKKYDTLNLCKLRYFIERGRIDTRFPITQRHLHDSKCVKVKNGVHLFNVNNYPFPYKIDITVASCDQSSVDVIKAVGGTVTIIHYDKVSLRAHVKPYKFEILPKTSRPDIKRVYELEKFRLMGCNVVYIKPLWLIKEEDKLVQEFKELYQNASNEDFDQMVLNYRKQILKEQTEGVVE